MPAEQEATSRKALRHIDQILGRFRELRDTGEMPLQQMLILVHVGLNPDTTQVEIVRALALSPSSVSRNIAVLSTLTDGLGLLTWVDHPTDRRAKLVTLTAKGKALITTLAKT